ncbi:glycine betaine ABC transporter substrate-binding protein [Shouchella lonarensis]|uniref:Glycine betaine/proline transport system substrate-binding protein n=1 Tax=Shouchella lonarensis TaxID=1464122 RepID=A0A1G6MLI8_9BACI|nr:glycine betaine ABC transporter substrate-binding protein [Shouchella lonarensis]SDC56413.1 glycine betaine/proline transport system substrate-binding protein [Shouchella lonarensis]
MKWKAVVGVVASMALASTLAACGSEKASNEEGNKKGSTEELKTLSKEEIAKDLTVITGIDPGSGVVTNAEKAVDEYGLDLTVQASQSAAMTQALEDAISKNEPIVVTGWNPHWKFTRYELKYLEDPKGVFGEAEGIHTIARSGLKDDKPEAYEVLDNFLWSEEDMGEVMVAIEEGTADVDAAKDWVEKNEEKVSEWTNGIEKVDSEELMLVYVNWDSEVASTNVIKLVLEEIGYNVQLSEVESAFMWQALANGEADASVAAWLPDTHASYYADYKDDIEDLGKNLDGEPKTGLVVPKYMDIDSIEDLKAEKE